MIKIKKEKKLLMRSFYISSVAVLCIFIAFFGTAQVYENTRRVGFGEYKKAVAYENGTLRILDFEFEIITRENE